MVRTIFLLAVFIGCFLTGFGLKCVEVSAYIITYIKNDSSLFWHRICLSRTRNISIKYVQILWTRLPPYIQTKRHNDSWPKKGFSVFQPLSFYDFQLLLSALFKVTLLIWVFLLLICIFLLLIWLHTGSPTSNCTILEAYFSILTKIFWCLKYFFIYSTLWHFMIYHYFFTYARYFFKN